MKDFTKLLFLLIIYFLSFDKLLANHNETNTDLHIAPTKAFEIKTIFKQLIRDNPTVILIDHDESDLEIFLRQALLSLENAGSVIYSFNPWWRFTSRGMELKPKVGALRTTAFRWTFICLIEEKRTRLRADKYLEELLAVGHAREDRFLFVGHFSFISTIMKSLQAEKFKNIIALPIDQDVLYQRKFRKQSALDFPRFKRLTEITDVFWFTGKTKSLNGQHFRISGTKFPPYLDVVYDTLGRKRLMGVNYQIFRHGSEHFNYTYEFNDDSEWKLTGKKYRNGTWDGVYGDLLYGKADIASVSTQTVDRSGLADFVGPFGRAHLIFVSAPPETYLGKYAIFRSYTMEVWGLILLFFTVFVFLFQEALKFSKMTGFLKQKDGCSFLRATLTLWSLSFEQTLEKRPKGTRLLMIIWVVFMVLIGTVYKSNMAAFISFPMPESKPKDFDHLRESSDYKIYFDLSGVSAYTYFERSNNSLIKTLRMRAKPVTNTTACVVNAFMGRKVICIGWDFTLKLAASKNLTIPQLESPLYSSTEPIWAAWYTFALAKNSIFTDAFQFIGQTNFEAGLTAYWRNRLLSQYRKYGMIWSQKKQGSDLFEKLSRLRNKSRSETKPLKVENFEFIFFILLGGISISSVGFFYEICSRSRCCCRNKEFYQPTATLPSNHQVIQQVERTEGKQLVPSDFVP